MHVFLKYLDIPFLYIFFLILFCSLELTAMLFFHVRTPWLWVPTVLICAYTIIVSFYWIWLFISSKRLQRNLELFEILQKKSLSLALSLEMNLLFSIYYFYVAVRYQSQWFANTALFYFSLTIARFILLRDFRFEHPSLRSQYKRYMSMGYIMLVMMICLLLMTLMAVRSNYVVEYPGHSIYAAAVFSLYLIISAVRGYIKHRHYRSPMLSGCQMISIAGALLGILSLQTAFLPMISHDPYDVQQINTVTGSVIFGVMICMSLYMIIHGGRMLSYGLDRHGNRIR